MASGDIGNNIRTYLLTISAVTDLLGTTTEIFTDRLPQRGGYTLPAIVLNVFGGRYVQHLTGSSNVARTRLQLECWADDRPAANALLEAVRKNLEHYPGAAGDDTVDISIGVNPRYLYEPPKDASEAGLYSATVDFLVWHDLPAVST